MRELISAGAHNQKVRRHTKNDSLRARVNSTSEGNTGLLSSTAGGTLLSDFGLIPQLEDLKVALELAGQDSILVALLIPRRAKDDVLPDGSSDEPGLLRAVRDRLRETCDGVKRGRIAGEVRVHVDLARKDGRLAEKREKKGRL